ncbi:MAG: hypothetical protein AAF960_30135, partial [Bacteroidota bacterium]
PLRTDTTSTHAIQSGLFQQLGFASTVKQIINTHQLSWTTKGKIDHFWQLTAANLQRWETGLGYQYQWDKRKSLRWQLKYLFYQTNRQDNGTAVITIPTAYQKWNSRLAYQWQPFKYNRSIFKAAWTKRIYAATANDQLRYWGFEGNFQTTQRFKRKGKKSSYLKLALSFQQRDYTNSVFETNWEVTDSGDWEAAENEKILESADWEDEEGDSNTYRRWQYFSASIDFVFYVTSTLKMTSGIAYEHRKDVWDKRFGYRQLAQFVAFKWTKQQWKINWKINTSFRKFTDLFADTEDDYLLQHLYLKNSFSVAYEITESWTIAAHLNFRKRWRNQPPASRNNYLPYFTGLTSLGLQYRFKKG